MDQGGSDGEAITVMRALEAEIGANLSRDLQSLLQMCFPGYPSRSYFKLPPHFRYLVGIARQADPEAMMVKAIGEQAWPEDDVDLLGHLF